MKIVAQRVVRPSDGASGVNAYCYLHPGQQWLDEPPTDLGRGTLSGKLIEIPPPGNRVRSYLDITTPDTTTNRAIAHVVITCADLLQSARKPLPWSLLSGETAFEFNLEQGLAEHWELELRVLLGYALQVRTASLP